MARILITGSSDGLGQAAARILTDQGHHVTLHARNEERAKEAKEAIPKAENVLIADLSNISEAKRLAEEANKLGPWDTVVHNAALGLRSDGKKTSDGINTLFAVNSLSPYILTCLMDKPTRLLYITSGLHTGGDESLDDMAWQTDRRWNAAQAYSDSKLQNAIMAKAVSRLWPDVQSCSMDPGWVKTKLGGFGAPGSVETPAKALAAYAAGEHAGIGTKSGIYFNPSGPKEPHRAVADTSMQEKYLKACEEFGKVSLPK